MKALPLFSLLAALSLGAAPNTGLKPVWEDNFDAKELDKAKWNVGGQARIVDGKLQIEVTPKDKPGFWNGSHAHTLGKFSYGQGYFEASIRAVQTKGRGWTVFGIRNQNMEKAPAASMYFVFTGADRIEPTLNIVDEAGSHRLAPKEKVIAMDGGKSYKKFLPTCPSRRGADALRSARAQRHRRPRRRRSGLNGRAPPLDRARPRRRA